MKVRLKELGEIITGNTPSKKIKEFWNSEDIYFIKPDIIEDSGVNEISETNEYISEEARKKARIVTKKSIFVTCIGSIGKIGIASAGEYAFNQQINAIVPNEKVQSKYLAYNLLYNKPRLVAMANAPVVPIINKRQFGEFIVNIETDIGRQVKIVNVLDRLTHIIRLSKQELEKLDELIKARFVEMFGDVIENPKGYYVASLQKLIDKGYITYHLDGNHGGNYPRSDEFVDSGVPYISANCIVNGEIDFSKAKFLTPERANKMRKGIAQDKDVLFAHNATVGPTAVLHTNETKIVLGTSLTAYRCNTEYIMPNYLKAYMLCDGFVRQYIGKMKQTTRNQVPITAQKEYQFLIPPINEQELFDNLVHQIDKSKLIFQKLHQKLNILQKKAGDI